MMTNKKPNLQYIILCDDVAVYQDSSKIAILGVFEQIFVDEFPSSYSKFWLLSRFTGGEGSFSSVNKILNPTGEIIFESESVSFNLENEFASYNINGQLIGLPLDIEGIYMVQTYLDGELINQLPLQVVSTPDDPIEQNEATYH